MKDNDRNLPILVAKAKEATVDIGSGTYRTSFRAIGRPFSGEEIDGAILSASGEQDSESSDPNVITKNFRFLSADTEIQEMHGTWLSIPEEVLEAGASLWTGKKSITGKNRPVPLKIDHSRKTMDLAGQVMSSEFVKKNGDVPAGINGSVAVDRILNPKAFRAVELGLVNAVSTGWDMEWKPSHPDLDIEDFWFEMGNVQKDGKRAVAVGTKLKRVSEVSLVEDGADPFSLDLDASNVNNNRVLDDSEDAPLINDDLEDNRMEFIKARLELKADASESACVDKIDSLKVEAAEAASTKAEIGRIFSALEVDSATSAVAKIIEFKTEFVHRSELETAKAEALTVKIDAAMHKAVSVERKISTAEATALRSWASKDFEAFTAYLEARPNGTALPITGSQSDSGSEEVETVSVVASVYIDPASGYEVKRSDLEAQAKSLNQNVDEVIAEAGLVAKSA